MPRNRLSTISITGLDFAVESLYRSPNVINLGTCVPHICSCSGVHMAVSRDRLSFNLSIGSVDRVARAIKY